MQKSFIESEPVSIGLEAVLETSRRSLVLQLYAVLFSELYGIWQGRLPSFERWTKVATSGAEQCTRAV